MSKNPYQRGNYSKLFAFWQSEKGIVTRQKMVDFAMSELGMKESEAVASVTVILSPRESTSRKGADCRGNFSAQGHLYFAEPLNKVKGEDRKFRLRWRKDVLAKRTRNGDVEVKAKVKPAKKAKSKPAKKAKAPSVKSSTVTAPAETAETAEAATV